MIREVMTLDLYIADVFDYFGERPFIVGVYDTEQKAWDAIQVVMDRIKEIKPDTPIESRFVAYVTEVQLNGFTPACMDWCYSG